MSVKPVTGERRHWLAIEALTFGLAYGAGLCWASVCLLASFRPAGGSFGAPVVPEVGRIHSVCKFAMRGELIGCKGKRQTAVSSTETGVLASSSS